MVDARKSQNILPEERYVKTVFKEWSKYVTRVTWKCPDAARKKEVVNNI